jgi:hypothetical protein
MRAKSTRPLRAALDRDTRGLTAFLVILDGRERGGLLEVRARRAGGRMAQRFYPAGALRRAAAELLELGERTDVYVGCAPRLRPAGDATAANRRAAAALGACASAVKNPASILRSPGTVHHGPRSGPGARGFSVCAGGAGAVRVIGRRPQQLQPELVRRRPAVRAHTWMQAPILQIGDLHHPSQIPRATGRANDQLEVRQVDPVRARVGRAMEQSQGAQLLARDALLEQLLFGDRREFEHLMQPRHGASLRGRPARDASHVPEDGYPVLLAVARMQPFGDHLRTIRLHRHDRARAQWCRQACAHGNEWGGAHHGELVVSGVLIVLTRLPPAEHGTPQAAGTAAGEPPREPQREQGEHHDGADRALEPVAR